MSDESEVSPLRLKRLRPVAAPSAVNSSTPSEAPASGSASPLPPVPEAPLAAQTPPAAANPAPPAVTPAGPAPAAAEPARRRPVLLPTAAPFGQGSPSNPAADGAPEAGDASPVMPLRYKPSAVPLPGSAGAKAPPSSEAKPAGVPFPVSPPPPKPAAPSAVDPAVQDASPLKLKMSNRLQQPATPPPRADKASAAPFPVVAPGAAPGSSENAPPLLPLPAAGLTMPPMGLKGGMPAPFVPADDSGATPPLVPLTSKGAPANLGTRPPLALGARPGPAGATKGEGMPPPLPRTAKKHTAKKDLLVFLLIVVLILAAAGAGLMYYLNPWGTKAAVSTVKSKLDAAAELPGQAVTKAQGAIQSARGNEQARLDAAVRGEELPDARALNTPPPGGSSTTQAKSPEPLETVNEEPADGVSGSTSGRSSTLHQVDITQKDPTVPPPNARFVKWGTALKVTGVFQGSPARALIEGRIVREGELIEPLLGVKFAGVDAEQKQVILQDETGAQVRLKY